MVSLTEAKQSISQAKATLSQRRAEAEQQEQTLKAQQRKVESQFFPRRSLRYQQEVIKPAGRALAGKVERQREIFELEKTGALGEISQGQKALKKYKTETLGGYEKGIAQYEKEVASYEKAQRENDQLNLAYRVYTGQSTAGSEFRSIPQKIKDKAKKLAESAERQVERVQEYYSKTSKEPPIVGYEVDLPSGGMSMTAKEYEKLKAQTEVQTDILPTRLEGVERTSLVKPPSTIMPVQEPTGILGRLQAKLSQKRSEIFAKQVRGGSKEFGSGLAGLGVGLGTTAVGTLQFGKSLITKPISTLKETGKGLTSTGKSILTGKGAPELGQTLRQEPGYALGRVLGEVAILKGTSVVGRSFSSIRTETPLRSLKTPSFVEYKARVITGGKEVPISKYNIFGEKTPPTLVRETSRIRQLTSKFDTNKNILKPYTKSYIRPARKFEVSTQDWVLGNRPFTVVEKTPTGKVRKFAEIKGRTEATDLSGFKGFDPLKKFTFTRLGEFKTGGTPLSEASVPKMFKKGSMKYFGEVQQTQLGRVVSPRRTEFNILAPNPGKTQSRSLVASEMELLTEADVYNVYGVKSSFKDITFPYARASGKGNIMTGKVIELKEPIVRDSSSKIISYKGSSTKKTPLDSTFQVQQTQLDLLPKPVIKQTKVKPQTRVIKPKNNLEVGGGQLGVTTSAFYGKGMYERTEGGLVPSISTPSVTTSPMVGNLGRTFIATGVSSGVIGRSFSATKARPNLDLRPNLGFEERLITRSMIKQVPKQKIKQKVKQKQKLQLRPLFKSPPRPPITSKLIPFPQGSPLIPLPSKKKKKKYRLLKKKSKKLLSQPLRYTPSFTALGLGIYGKKPKKLLGRTYSPGIRPIIKI